MTLQCMLQSSIAELAVWAEAHQQGTDQQAARSVQYRADYVDNSHRDCLDVSKLGSGNF